jgi:hypothetical protein
MAQGAGRWASQLSGYLYQDRRIKETIAEFKKFSEIQFFQNDVRVIISFI